LISEEFVHSTTCPDHNAHLRAQTEGDAVLQRRQWAAAETEEQHVLRLDACGKDIGPVLHDLLRGETLAEQHGFVVAVVPSRIVGQPSGSVADETKLLRAFGLERIGQVADASRDAHVCPARYDRAREVRQGLAQQGTHSLDRLGRHVGRATSHDEDRSGKVGLVCRRPRTTANVFGMRKEVNRLLVFGRKRVTEVQLR
jgi:hypothetical protein